MSGCRAVQSGYAGSFKRRAGGTALLLSLIHILETRLSNGLEKLHAGEADTVIIAGMGGELEISILENGKQLWGSIPHWIFSPQSDLEKFRRYLKKNGFFIEDEAMILDEGKFYTVLKAGVGTEAVSYTHLDVYKRQT